ncbi:hypothetical protein CN069_28995 [Sinorhizobium meliloti]|nr:hypothetical protein CN147_12935 [Sinorhizobium meliloti]RVP95478.1 hypothetical protein CN069_28995 [Sinorhizobium meliloti]
MAGEAHWNEEAKALIAGLILKIVAVESYGRRHLGTLREYLTLPPDRFADLLKGMQETDAAGGLIARAANRHLGKSGREAAGVLSAAQRHTHFLDSPRMSRVLDESYFSFADLKKRTATVFLVLPPDRLSSYSRWLRLIVTQSLIDMARDPAKPQTPVLYLLDEFAALGHLAPVERAIGPHGRLRRPALAHPAGRPSAARHLRAEGRNLPVQCRRAAGVQRQRSRQRPPRLRSARPGDGGVPDHGPRA